MSKSKQQLLPDLGNLAKQLLNLQNDPNRFLKSRIFSVAELCAELHVSRQTLNNWERQEILKARYFGGRKFYLGTDLLETLLKTTS